MYDQYFCKFAYRILLTGLTQTFSNLINDVDFNQQFVICNMHVDKIGLVGV